jgi:hypothetical protein
MDMTSRNKGILAVHLLTSIVISVAVVFTSSAVYSALLDRDLDLSNEAGPLVFQVVIVFIPFLVLTCMRVIRVAPWLFCMILTVFFWAIYIHSGIRSQREGAGVNIGIALLMLGSPLLITAMTLVFNRIVRRKPANSGTQY